jgi:hypothetical protein
MLKNKLVIGSIFAGIVIALGSVGLYAASPMMAFGTLKDAAIAHDKDKLDEVVDFPAVRENLKSQISTAIVAKVASSPDAQNNPFMAVGALLAPAITDRMVDSVVTPDGLSAMLTNGKLVKADKPAGSAAPGDRSIESHLEYRTLNRARVTINRKDNPSAKLILTMERRGLFEWKLIRIDLPANLLNATSPTENEAAPVEPPNDTNNTKAVKRRAKGTPYGRRKGTPFSRSSSGEARSPQLAQRVAAG